MKTEKKPKERKPLILLGFLRFTYEEKAGTPTLN